MNGSYGDGTVRVLYVGRDPSSAETAARSLAAADGRLDVASVSGVPAALGRLDAEADGTDCVVAEYALGDRTGVDLLTAVRARVGGLPFVLVAESGSEAVASSAISAGVTDYVHGGPPNREARLAAAVADAVDDGPEDAADEAGRSEERRGSEDGPRSDADAGWTGERGPATNRALNALDDLFYAFDGGGLRQWNDRFRSVTGYDDRELAGMESTAFVAPDDRDRVATAVEQVERAEASSVEISLLTATGEQLPYEVTAAPVFDRDGDPIGFAGVGRALTTQPRRERRLRRAVARPETLFERSPDMIDVHDEEGRLLDANGRFYEELGYSPADLEDMYVWDVDPSVDPAEVREMWAGMEPGDVQAAEGRFRRADGSTFPVEVHVGRLDLAGEERFLAMSRDLTERKRRERELERQNERLDQFAGVVSHDLRNPLNVAQGRTELARMDGEDPEDHLAAVEHAHERMETMIEDLLALARDGEDATEIVPVPLDDAVHEAWTEVGTADAELVVDTGRAVRADERRLRRLLANLLGNAVDHGGPDVTVTVGDLPDGFYVEDDGPGIPPADRDRVFDRDYSTADDGNGLGLAIVDRVCDAHGWSAAVTDGANGGARFEVTGEDLVAGGGGTGDGADGDGTGGS